MPYMLASEHTEYKSGGLGCGYTVGDQIQPLKSLKNTVQHNRSQKCKVPLRQHHSTGNLDPYLQGKVTQEHL